MLKTEQNPELEFLARLRDRHARDFRVIPHDVLANVKRELENGNVPMAEFLERDAAKTVNPSGLTNPGGYYRKLAKDLVLESRTAVMERLYGIRAAAVIEGSSDQRCTQCNGTGYRTPGEHCDCPMGRDLARVDRRIAKEQEGAEITPMPRPPQRATASRWTREAPGTHTAANGVHVSSSWLIRT